MKTHTQLLKRFFATLLFSTLVLAFPNSPAASSFDNGFQAYKAGDYKKALEILEPLAEQGDADAQYLLGFIHDKGHGVEQDEKRVEHWYKKAAEQGQIKAQTTLGYMYKEGWRVKQDLKQAVHWYKKAAEQGDRGGQFRLAGMYSKGHGVGQDEKQAAHWYRKAAEQSHAASQISLVWMYIGGNGVEQSDLEAYKWYSLASVHKNPDWIFWDKLPGWFTEIYLDFKLSSDQKKAADEWVKNWKPKYNAISENGIFIPTTCPICSADTHSTVPQRKDGELKGIIKTKCLQCGFEKEIFIDISPTKRRSPDDRKNFMS